MDADGLPLVGPGINLAQVDAINPKRMLAFLNHFISHTVGFLNHFSVVAEEKLENLAVRIQRLETTLSILEAKLSSIPGLDDVTATVITAMPVAATAPPAATTSQMPVVTMEMPSLTVTPVEPVSVSSNAANGEVPVTVAASETPTNRAADDPRYSKFFRLLSLKIPREALQQRMAIEGLDPSILDNPNAVLEPSTTTAAAVVAPSGGHKQNKQRDSDDDFSDDNEQSSSLSSSSGSSDFS